MRPPVDTCPRPDLARVGACGCVHCCRSLVEKHAPHLVPARTHDQRSTGRAPQTFER